MHDCVIVHDRKKNSCFFLLLLFMCRAGSVLKSPKTRMFKRGIHLNRVVIFNSRLIFICDFFLSKKLEVQKIKKRSTPGNITRGNGGTFRSIFVVRDGVRFQTVRCCFGKLAANARNT